MYYEMAGNRTNSTFRTRDSLWSVSFRCSADVPTCRVPDTRYPSMSPTVLLYW